MIKLFLKISSILIISGCLSGSLGAQELDDYLLIAALNNPSVLAEYSEFEAALAEVPQVSSLKDPVLTMSAFGQMVETRLGAQEARFSLMQMFPWFGTLKSRKDAATLMAGAEFQGFLDARKELFLKVSEQFFDLYELEKQIRFQQENFEILSQYRELALAEVRSGSGALVDVLQAEIMIEQAGTGLKILRLQREPLKVQFNMLLNRDKSLEIAIPEEMEIAAFKLEPDQDIDFDDHPRVMAFEKMRQAAVSREEVAKKEGFPSIGLGVDYMVISKRPVPGLDGNGRDAIMPMLSVSLPIFRKKYEAAKKQARFLQESYSQRKKAVRNSLNAQLEKAVFEFKSAGEMLGLYKKQLEDTQRVLDLMLSSYKNSAADFQEVLRLRQELLEYHFKTAQAESDQLRAMAEIQYLTGKISEDEIQK